MAELLAAVGEEYGPEEWETVNIVLSERTHAADLLPEAATRVVESGVLNKKQAEPKLGEQLLTDRIDSIVDDDVWDRVAWLNASLASELLGRALERPRCSVYGLLGRLSNTSRPSHRGVHNRWLRRALLGFRISRSAVKTEPNRSRLAAISGVAFAHGVVRIARLIDRMDDGLPPTEPYSARERELIGLLVPQNVRRLRRTCDWLGTVAYESRQRNDAADRLSELWLLHPVSSRLAGYLPLLYRAYVEGRTPEVVILSRVVLERAVADSTSALELAPRDSRMNSRINALAEANVLSLQTAVKARAVWQRGNKVVHEDPGFVADPFETLAYLLEVLDELGPLLRRTDVE